MLRPFSITAAMAALAVAGFFLMPVQQAAASSNTTTCTDISIDNTSYTGNQTNNDSYGTVSYGDIVGVGGETDVKPSTSTCANMTYGTPVGTTTHTTGNNPPVTNNDNDTLTANEYSTAACGGTITQVQQVSNGSYPNTATFALNNATYDTSNVTLDTTLTPPSTTISFKNHFVGGNSPYGESQSPCVSVTVQQTSCTNLNTFTITPSSAIGDGMVLPGTSSTWSYKFKVQNCTPLPYAVKIQGGNAGWLTNTDTTVSADQGLDCTKKTLNKNAVETCTGTMNSGETATVTVNVSGTTPPSPDDTLSLSGIWSVVWAAGRTDAANNVTICSDSNFANCP